MAGHEKKRADFMEAHYQLCSLPASISSYCSPFKNRAVLPSAPLSNDKFEYRPIRIDSVMFHVRFSLHFISEDDRERRRRRENWNYFFFEKKCNGGEKEKKRNDRPIDDISATWFCHVLFKRV